MYLLPLRWLWDGSEMEKQNALRSFIDNTGLEPDLAAQILSGRSSDRAAFTGVVHETK